MQRRCGAKTPGMNRVRGAAHAATFARPDRFERRKSRYANNHRRSRRTGNPFDDKSHGRGGLLIRTARSFIRNSRDGASGWIRHHPFLKVGPYRYPLIPRESADVVIGMDEGEASNNTHFLREGGLLIINHAGNGGGFFSVDANKLARELGHIKWSNMVLLRFAVSRLGHPFTYPAVREAIARVSPGPFLSHNLRAFDLGFEKGSNQEKKRPEKEEKFP